MDIKQTPCLLCDEPSVINHLYQPFRSCDFGPMRWQQFTLCETCNDLFRNNHLARLADRFIANEEKHIEDSFLVGDFNPILARAMLKTDTYRADIYHLLCEFNNWRKAKLN